MLCLKMKWNFKLSLICEAIRFFRRRDNDKWICSNIGNKFHEIRNFVFPWNRSVKSLLLRNRCIQKIYSLVIRRYFLKCVFKHDFDKALAPMCLIWENKNDHHQSFCKSLMMDDGIAFNQDCLIAMSTWPVFFERERKPRVWIYGGAHWSKIEFRS